MNSPEITLLKDREWAVIDGEPCRVINFTPMASISSRKVVTPPGMLPYAAVTFECKKLARPVTGFITHKIDFMHLWAAFKERTVKENEEVLISWSKKYYKLKLLKYVPGFWFWPKLWVMTCQKGDFELITDRGYKPELQGEARYNAEKPIIEWKPEVMA